MGQFLRPHGMGIDSLGNLYVYPENPEAGSRPFPLDAVPRFGTVENVTAAIEAQYQNRPDFPPTPDEYLPGIAGAPASRTWAEASYADGVFSARESSDRLRMVVDQADPVKGWINFSIVERL